MFRTLIAFLRRFFVALLAPFVRPIIPASPASPFIPGPIQPDATAQQLFRDVETLLSAEQQVDDDIMAALLDPVLDILAKPHVVDVAVGSASLGELGHVDDWGPLILVSQIVPQLTLPPDQRFPTNITVNGNQMAITVVEASVVSLVCIEGIPNTQHADFGGHPPGGVAIAGVEQHADVIPVGKRGSSGIVVQVTNPPRPIYMLTAKHVIHGYRVAQPWDATKVIANHIASTNDILDGALHELPNPPNPTIQCFGKPKDSMGGKHPKGLHVRKSGGASGVTGSLVFGSSATHYFIRNDPLSPASTAAQIYNYIESGDSGSVSVVGIADRTAPDDPLGTALEQAIELAMTNNAVPPADKPARRIVLRRQYTNRVVGLNYGVSAMKVGGVTTRVAQVVKIDLILAALGIRIVT